MRKVYAGKIAELEGEKGIVVELEHSVTASRNGTSVKFKRIPLNYDAYARAYSEWAKENPNYDSNLVGKQIAVPLNAVKAYAEASLKREKKKIASRPVPPKSNLERAADDSDIAELDKELSAKFGEASDEPFDPENLGKIEPD